MNDTSLDQLSSCLALVESMYTKVDQSSGNIVTALYLLSGLLALFFGKAGLGYYKGRNTQKALKDLKTAVVSNSGRLDQSTEKITPPPSEKEK
jgi:hypothetical protein